MKFSELKPNTVYYVHFHNLPYTWIVKTQDIPTEQMCAGIYGYDIEDKYQGKTTIPYYSGAGKFCMSDLVAHGTEFYEASFEHTLWLQQCIDKYGTKAEISMYDQFYKGPEDILCILEQIRKLENYTVFN